MRRVAVTGHMDLAGGTEQLLRDALPGLLTELAAGADGLTGLSCLAPGADAVFAEAVLAAGGTLEVVLPFHDYRSSLAAPAVRGRFDRLVAAASEVTVLPYPEACLAAFEAANSALLKRADALVAVWDGRPPARGGGTATTVAEAREAGLPVHVLWPKGARRDGGR
ncbi:MULTISPECIES: hypothetical protein [Streptomyces]|uniref:Uncharacterized protein n=1 Tax=Streptomyces ramulosus TaxID=47762 RepID=A0ABW1FTH9_9ACTN